MSTTSVFSARVRSKFPQDAGTLFQPIISLDVVLFLEPHRKCFRKNVVNKSIGSLRHVVSKQHDKDCKNYTFVQFCQESFTENLCARGQALYVVSPIYKLSFSHVEHQRNFHHSISAPKRVPQIFLFDFLDKLREALHGNLSNFRHLTVSCTFHVISEGLPFLLAHKTTKEPRLGDEIRTIWFIHDDGAAVLL